ncbi:signal peptidase I [Facklamia miroungae]|uniref:Signal peptidase I n=1 Tax=Facklamia miroungae TaxID=120956 RepID=A0A1G7P750_9LACT|nr:signal peptidase I [Facklamia miroungae]NKZ28606.1 signal peptidase I [Facklamia miroungae]SDF82115.1 signal peptidase I [Facklamia miroungae]
MGSFFRNVLIELVNIIFMILAALFIFIAVRNYLAQPFQVEGKSMNPTLYQEDHLILWKQFDLERFDIVVFPDPMGSGKTYVKRLIALPGESIEVKDDQLLINGHIIEEPYLDSAKTNNLQNYTEDFTLWEITGDNVIPENKVFVMGDNRPGSGDSRQFGYVDIDAIQGEANFIYFPLNRVGKVGKFQASEQTN